MTEFAKKSESAPLLPGPFASLEPFVQDWALPTEKERTESRLRSDFVQIKAFHDAVLPQLDSIFQYLNGFSLDDLPEECRRLLYLTLALAEVAPSIHFYKGEPPTYILDVSRFQRWDIPNMTPAF
jgi:hypothetical protein